MVRSRPAFLPAAGILCGCLFMMLFRRSLPAAAAAGIFAAAAVWFVPVSMRRRAGAALFAVCFLLGALRTGQTNAFLERVRGEYPAGSTCRLAGEILAVEEKDGTAAFVIRVRPFQNGPPCRVRAYAAFAPAADGVLRIGQKVEITGTVLEDRIARNEGSFDARRYDESCGIAMRIRADVIRPGRRAAVEWAEALCRLHRRVTQVYERYLPGEESGLLAGLVLGDRAAMDPEAKQLLTDAGFAHILAVSGTHVGILGRRTYRRLKRMLLSRVLAGLFSGGLLVFYCLLCGSSVSALRATVMFLIYLAAEACGESYDAASAAAWCAAAFLLIRPQVLYAAGFLLSFGAAFCICLICEPLQKRLRKKKWPKLLQAAAFAGMIQLSMLPLVLQLFFEVPVYAGILNLLILPLVSPLLAAGLWGGLIGAGCLAAFPVMPAAADGMLRGLFFLCHGILYLMEAASARSLALPFARYTAGAPGWGLAAAFWLLLYLAVQPARAAGGRRGRVSRGGRRFGCGQLVRAGWGVLLGLLLFGRIIRGPEAVMLDVGQGTGIFLTDGRNTQIMIDGGSTSDAQVGTRVIRPFLAYSGAAGVDYWFVSHTDADHVSGLLELLGQRFPVGTILLPAAEAEMDETVLAEIRSLAAENGTEVLWMYPRDQVRVRRGSRVFTVTCFGPQKHSPFSGANDNSLVLWLEWDGMRIFCAGDIGMEAEDALAPGLPDAEIYIADHHGSNTSSGEALLAALKPEAALISCGAGNPYGHPGKDAEERMRRSGASIFVTAECGQITAKSVRGRTVIQTYRKDGFDD